MPRTNTQTIVIKAPFGGWASTLSSTATLAPVAALEGKDGQYSYSKSTTLFHFEKLGHIAPGYVMTPMDDSGGYVNHLLLNADMASNSKPFAVLKNSRLVRIASTGDATEAKYDITLTGSHSGHTAVTASNNPDVLIIKDLASTPVEYILWSYEDATDADVAIMKIDGTGETDNWFSTLSGSGVLRKNVPLKMAIGPDGFVYITNGSSLAQVSITGAIASATGNATKLNFGPGWGATGVCKWNNYIVVCGAQQVSASGFSGITREQVRAWFWNTTDINYTYSFDIPDNFANGIFSDGQRLYLLTNGRNNSSKVWEYNGAAFVKKFETQFIGTSSTPIQGGLESYQDSLLIGASVAGVAHIYRYIAGSFHDEMILSDGTNEAVNVGMVKNLFQAMLYAGVSYGAGPTYKIFYQAIFTKYYINADFRTRLYELGVKSKIKRIRLWLSQFGSGASLTLSLFSGYDTLNVGGSADKLNKTITNAALGAITSYEFNKEIPNLSSFYMNFRFSHANPTDTAAIIERVEIDWEPQNIHS
jgi:hypothetical protein